MQTPEELKNVGWPDCYWKCSLANELGVSECDNVSYCQHKFPKIKDEISFPVIEPFNYQGFSINNDIRLKIRKSKENYELNISISKKDYFIGCIPLTYEKYIQKNNFTVGIYIDYVNGNYFKKLVVIDLTLYNKQRKEIYNENIKIPYSEVKDVFESLAA